MDHSEAIRLMAAEKYLLNELTPELRRSFEEHFFGCPECEFDVQSGYALIDGSKEVFFAPPAVEAVKDNVRPNASPWYGWLRPALTVPVMAMLLIVALYQNLVTVPQLKSAVEVAHAPRILSAVYLTAGASRGSNPAVVTAKRNYPIPLTFDIPADSRFTSYVCELQSPSGELEGSLPVSAEAARNSVSVSMYPRRGNSGVYQLVVFGVPQDAGTQKVEIERQSFEIRIQD
jgi:Putative zinc-finger